MAAEKENEVLSYHARLSAAARGVADVMSTHGLEAAFDAAAEESSQLQHSDAYLMQRAARMLIATSDPNSHEAGFGFLEWEAETEPDPTTGGIIASEVTEHEGREDGTEIMRRSFEIALMHFRNAVKVEGFEPDSSFFDELDSVLNRMDCDVFNDMYIAAIREFSPLALQAAATLDSRPPSTEIEDQRYLVEDILSRTAIALHEPDPDASDNAYGLIRNEMIKRTTGALIADKQLTQAFRAQDFEKAKDILAANSTIDIIDIWFPLIEQLGHGDTNDSWGNQVLDTVVETLPDYFHDINKRGHGAVDFHLGAPVGYAIGLLGRTDVADTFLVQSSSPNSGFLTAASIAYGLGKRGNEAGLQHLLKTTEYFTESVRAELKKNYEVGAQESAAKNQTT